MKRATATGFLCFCVSLLGLAQETDENTIIGEWILEPIRFEIGLLDFAPAAFTADDIKEWNYISKIDFIDTDFVRVTYAGGTTIGGVYTIKSLGKSEYSLSVYTSLGSAFDQYTYELTIMTVEKAEISVQFAQHDDGHPIITTQKKYAFAGGYEVVTYLGIFQFRKADGSAVFLEAIIPKSESIY